MANPSTPRNIATIGKWAQRATKLFVLATGLHLVLTCYILAFEPNYSFVEYSDDHLTLDLVFRVNALFFTIALLIALVINGVWLVRAGRNAAEVTSGQKQITGGWALGWFFVPIANYFMPYRAMQHLWNVSTAGAESWNKPTPPFFKIWWACWVILSLLSVVKNRNGQLEAIELAEIGLTIVSAYYFLRIIRDVTEAQSNPGRNIEKVFD